jgi:hypothetical protein
MINYKNLDYHKPKVFNLDKTVFGKKISFQK